VTLAYPKEWKIEDRSHDDKCIPGVVECLIRIVAPNDPETKITLIRIDFSFAGKDISVTEMDETMWALEPFPYAEYGLEKEVILISKRSLQVGGELAVERVFHEPLMKNKRVIGTLYVVRILVISDRKIYHFYLNTIDATGLETYQELMEQIGGTISFR
jgi:hypothetical protein